MQISVRQARLLKGMTQAEMAEGLKVHVQTYRKIEKNANLATIEQAKKISALTGVPYNEIFFEQQSTFGRRDNEGEWERDGL